MHHLMDVDEDSGVVAGRGRGESEVKHCNVDVLPLSRASDINFTSDGNCDLVSIVFASAEAQEQTQDCPDLEGDGHLRADAT